MAKKDRRYKYDSDTEKPVMLSLRLPRDLNERLERYASEHQMKVSALVRDAIEMRLDVEVDPRYRSAGSTTDATEFQIDGASVLRDIQATLERYEARFQAIERQTTPAGNGLSDGVSYNVIHGNTAEACPQQDTVPDVDTTRYFLGKLCRNRHNYQGTGQSLRHLSADHPCVECKNVRSDKWRKKAATK